MTKEDIGWFVCSLLMVVFGTVLVCTVIWIHSVLGVFGSVAEVGIGVSSVGVGVLVQLERWTR